MKFLNSNRTYNFDSCLCSVVNIRHALLTASGLHSAFTPAVDIGRKRKDSNEKSDLARVVRKEDIHSGVKALTIPQSHHITKGHGLDQYRE